MRSRRTLSVAAALAVGAVLALGTALPASADAVVCLGDPCDGGQWQAARGPADEMSYWGMGAGHDCTNYVAWKLGSNGVSRPATNPGNAADWAAGARADGILVDDVPTVGSVAQWNSYAAGMPYEGHVAYVEKVNDDGTVLVSEDAWRPGGGGPLRFRIVTTSTVSNFIHYSDTATQLRQIVAGGGMWTQRGTGVTAAPAILSAVGVGRRAQVAYVQDGALVVASSTTSGWTVTPTHVASQARAISAVAMDGTLPTIVTLEGDKLVISSYGRSGWSSMYTGIQVSGDMTAVNAGGRWPTVLVTQGGSLYTVTNSGGGWIVTPTGVDAVGPITAASIGGALVDAYTVEQGTLFRLWFDGSWWHRDSTRVPATGTAVATATEGSSQVVLAQDGTLTLVSPIPNAWQTTPLGVAAGSAVAAVDLGGLYPVVLQAG